MKPCFTLLLLLLFAINSSAQSSNDFYWWNTTSLNMKMSAASDFNLSTKTHYNQSQHLREMTYVDVAAIHQMNDWLKVGLSFRLLQYPKTGTDDYEYRPQIYTTLFSNRHVVKYRTTFRFEQRWFKLAEDHQRVYNNVYVDFPGLVKQTFKPLFGEELFYKLNGEGFHLARLYGGFGLFSTSHVGVDLFYVWQSTKKADSWQNSDVVALNLKFKI